MNRVQKAAILTRLVRKMREKESWCGETHIQKALYIAQELLQIPTGFEFILYKHGPFSFDLRDELSALRADKLLRIEPQPRPFGPRFKATEQSAKIESRFPKTLKKSEEKLNFVACKLQGKGVAELERLATALYVMNRYENCKSIADRAAKLTELKPHISSSDAQAAFEQITEIQKQALEITA